MTDTVETAPKIAYAIQTTSIDFFDNTKDDRRGAYCTKTELKARIAEGKRVNKHIQLGRQVDSLDDVKILMRAAELGGYNSYSDPYGPDEDGTRIVTRKIVKIEELV